MKPLKDNVLSDLHHVLGRFLAGALALGFAVASAGVVFLQAVNLLTPLAADPVAALGADAMIVNRAELPAPQETGAKQGSAGASQAAGWHGAVLGYGLLQTVPIVGGPVGAVLGVWGERHWQRRLAGEA